MIHEGIHEHDWVADRIAVGSGVCSDADVAKIQRAGITHVIDCRMYPTINGKLYATPEPLYCETAIRFVHCPTNDPGIRPKTLGFFVPGIRFAIEALRDPHARLLVHCDQGINRGPSMAYSVLRVRGMTANEAEYAIRTARAAVGSYGLAFMVDAERAVVYFLENEIA